IRDRNVTGVQTCALPIFDQSQTILPDLLPLVPRSTSIRVRPSCLISYRSYLAVRRSGLLLAVAGLETGHTATGVEDLLLAGVERVARGAHLGADDAGVLGAAGGERVAAGADDLGLDVLGVDVRLHVSPSPGRWVGTRPGAVNQNRRPSVPRRATQKQPARCGVRNTHTALRSTPPRAAGRARPGELRARA